MALSVFPFEVFFLDNYRCFSCMNLNTSVFDAPQQYPVLIKRVINESLTVEKLVMMIRAQVDNIMELVICLAFEKCLVSDMAFFCLVSTTNSTKAHFKPPCILGFLGPHSVL